MTLSSAEIERGWHATFSTSNPYCPCDLKSFTKAVRWAEHALRAALAGGEASEASEFHVDERGTLWFADGGCRPATSVECAMWKRLNASVHPALPSGCEHSLGSSWRPIESAPDETPVWLYDASGAIWIGERVDTGDGWLWGNTYMGVYFGYFDRKWNSDGNELDDDYQPTLWMPLPYAPNQEVKP